MNHSTLFCGVQLSFVNVHAQLPLPSLYEDGATLWISLYTPRSGLCIYVSMVYTPKCKNCCLLFCPSSKTCLTSHYTNYTHWFILFILYLYIIYKIYIFPSISLSALFHIFTPPPPLSFLPTLSFFLPDWLWGEQIPHGFLEGITMETGSATRVCKSTSCVGGTVRGGAFPPPPVNWANSEWDATGIWGGFQRTDIRNYFNFPEIIDEIKILHFVFKKGNICLCVWCTSCCLTELSFKILVWILTHISRRRNFKWNSNLLKLELL